MAGKKDVVEQALKLIAGSEPQNTAKAYKLFRQKDGKLYPLFVDADEEVAIGQWLKAKAGEQAASGKVKSKLGELAYRPGWHAGDLPIATHIGARSHKDPKLPPDTRPSNQVWAEVEMADDVDWQKVANERARMTKKGTPDPKTAHITDQVPYGGYYRYKTNPNMAGNWMIGGDMRVNRILSDDEVKAINDAAGVADLPRREGYQTKGRVVGDVVDQAMKLVTGAADEAPTRIKLGSKVNRPDWDSIMDEIYSGSQEHPFSSSERVFDNRATFHAYPVGDELHLSDIRSLQPNSGAGTDTLNYLKAIADKHGVPITGTAKTYHSGDKYIQDTERLADWYRKRGFEVGEGYPEDGYEIRYNPRIAKGGGGLLDDAVRLAGKLVSGEGDEAVNAGIRAYHGSPHDYPAERLVRFPTGKEEYIVGQPNVLPDLPQGAEVIQDFPLGRMRMDKIGTGEGAQAYGHGLYTAEKEGIARGYRDTLANKRISWTAPEVAAKYDPKLLEILEKELRHKTKDEVMLLNKQYSDDAKETGRRTVMADMYEALASGDISPGRMYEVNINANPEHFLDWDKPLSEQPEQAAKALERLGESDASKYGEGGGLSYYMGDPESYSGESVYRYLASQFERPEASEILKVEGIPGIKYLDAGSRGVNAIAQSHLDYLKSRLAGTESFLEKMKANRYTPKSAIEQYEKSAIDDRAAIAKLQEEMKQTHNYVVFDDKLISIIRKYGIAGASAMVGYDLMENLDPKQALAATMADRDYKVNNAISETDEVDDALRVAKDVGGSTSSPVMMEDAKGNKYDAQGNIIPPTAPGPNPQRTSTPQEVGQRAAQDPATFDAMMERYAVPDRDIADYEATRAAVQQQPQQIQQMTHVGAKPRREMTINMPMFGGEYSMGTAPYDVASGLQGMAQGAYDFKTAPAYFFPPTAPFAFGADLFESRMADDPVGLALNLALTPQGASAAKSAGRTVMDVFRQNPKTIGTATGAGAATMSSDEAEAGPARWFSKAVEAARAIPMNKMTGEQALAMLRKGTSPEELRWMGADDFLTGQKQVSKDDLVAFLEKNRVQPKEIVLGGGDKPTKLENIDVTDIPAEIRDRHPEVYRLSDKVEKLRDELVRLRSMPDQSGLDYYDNFRAVSQEFSTSKAELMRVKEALKKEYVESIGGLGRPTKFGPDTVHGETLTTPGGKTYSENLYALPKKDIYTPFVDQMRKDVWAENYKEAIEGGFTEERARKFADKFNNLKPHELAKFLNKEDELESVFQAQKSYEPQYKGGHWSDVSPDVLFHTRTNELVYEPPGANRPYRVHNVEETQSDPGQAGRKRGFKDQRAMAEVARLRQETQELRAKLKSEQSRIHAEHEARIAPYVKSRVEYERELREKYKKGEISLGDMNRLAEAYAGPEPELTAQYRAATDKIINPLRDKIVANEAKIESLGKNIGDIPMMPYVTSTESWTDRAIKQELDRALDKGFDYFSWTPGETHIERYDLEKHISKIEYNPDDGSLMVYNPNGKMVVNESIGDPSELDEYVGKELADKIRAEERSRSDSIDDAYEVYKDEETGEWTVNIYGDQVYDYSGDPLVFGSKGEAKDYLNQMKADDYASNPVSLSGLDLKVGGEGMRKYYDSMYLKRVQEVIRKATGEKPVIETIEVQTADGPRKQLGIRLTDDMREKARFSDFQKGGRVTGGNTYDSNSTVANALALTREY